MSPARRATAYEDRNGPGNLLAGSDTSGARVSRSLFPLRSRGLLTAASKSVNCGFLQWRRCPTRWTNRCRIFSSRNERPLSFTACPPRPHGRGIAPRYRNPAAVLAKWDRETRREPTLRPLLERIVSYRRHVLAIFENLIVHDSTTQKLQNSCSNDFPVVPRQSGIANRRANMFGTFPPAGWNST